LFDKTSRYRTKKRKQFSKPFFCDFRDSANFPEIEIPTDQPNICSILKFENFQQAWFGEAIL
jgi:hypothetical protein